MRDNGRCGGLLFVFQLIVEPKVLANMVPRFLTSFLSHWNRQKSLFNFKYFRLLAIWFAVYPVLAVATQDIPPEVVVRIPAGGGKQIELFTLHFEMPFSWDVLWWSAAVYVAAWFVHFAACPSYIKRYSNYNEYKGYGHSTRWIVHEAYEVLRRNDFWKDELMRVLVQKGLVKASTLQGSEKPVSGSSSTSIAIPWEGKWYDLSMKPEKDSIAEQELFWELFEVEAKRRSVLRYIVWVLLAMSAVLFVWELLQHILAGVAHSLA